MLPVIEYPVPPSVGGGHASSLAEASLGEDPSAKEGLPASLEPGLAASPVLEPWGAVEPVGLVPPPASPGEGAFGLELQARATEAARAVTRMTMRMRRGIVAVRRVGQSNSTDR